VLVEWVDEPGAWAASGSAKAGEDGFDDLFAQHEHAGERANTAWGDSISPGLVDPLDELFATKLGQVVGCLSWCVGNGLLGVLGEFGDLRGKLRGGEASGVRGQGHDGLTDGADTRFVQVDASEATTAARRGLNEFVKDTVGEIAVVGGVHDIEKIRHHSLELGQHDRKFLDDLAAAQSLDVVSDGLDAQYAGTLVVDLEGQRPEVNLEDGEIVGGVVQNLSDAQLLSTGTQMRPVFVTEDGLQPGYVEVPTCSVDESLEERVQGRAASEEQIATILETILDLIGGIAVMKSRALLLIDVEGETQASGQNPTVTDFGHPPYSAFAAQGICELVQGLNRTPHKAVTLPLRGDSLLASLSVDPFVTVEHDLYTKRWVTTHLDCDVAPVGIDDVKVVVVDVGPRSPALQVRHTFVAALDLPDQAGRFGYEYQEDALEAGIRRHILVCQLVLALSRCAVQQWYLAFVCPSVNAAAKPARHLPQVLLIQRLIGPCKLSPPGAERSALLSQWEVAVEHDAVDAIIEAVQQICMICGEVVWRAHGANLTRTIDTAVLRRRTSFSKRSLGKSVVPYQ